MNITYTKVPSKYIGYTCMYIELLKNCLKVNEKLND